MDLMESGIPNKPGDLDNHYDLGGKMLFVDSHVEWIDHGKWDHQLKSGNCRIPR
tara:strand:- start:468 stop:629 length:162 start_codon:yes stop_codon:yes gene_type:complete